MPFSFPVQMAWRLLQQPLHGSSADAGRKQIRIPGNILSKKAYAYTAGTLGAAVHTDTYTYGDANWKDKLTAFNGKTITYDAIGNPLKDNTWLIR